jgi:hypothetical protein
MNTKIYLFTFLILFSFCFLIAQEKVTNGDFELGTRNWALELHETATATFNIDSSKGMNGVSSAHITITNSDATDWHLQFQQIIGSILAGKKYNISFQACASEPVTIVYWIQQYHGSYGILQSKTLNITPDNQTFQDSMDVSTTDSNVKIAFALGALSTGVEVWFDAVSVIQSTPVTVESNQGSVPNNFSLTQNYPNPFNPSTRIEFSIGQENFVSLKIFDLLGREIKSLVQEVLPAGKHSIRFDAADLNSGIYYYRLDAGSLSETRKMMLLR